MSVFVSIKPIAKKVIPVKYHHTFGEIRRWGISLLLYGYRFTCPICGGHFRKLLPIGLKNDIALNLIGGGISLLSMPSMLLYRSGKISILVYK